MAIEVRELVVRAVIAGGEKPPGTVPAAEVTAPLPEAVVEDLLARVLERLREQEER